MPWQALKQFRDPSVPKLNNLRRAATAGLRVPPTFWMEAACLRGQVVERPAELGDGPCIIRSGSPTEDTRLTSNAGQLLSLPVHEASEFDSALRRVVEALPVDDRGLPRGVVFVQPLVAALEAGVAFFDGFYYERTQMRGANEGLTSGQVRGEVRRGHLDRDDSWSDWLSTVYAVFGVGKGGDPRLDIEFARDAAGMVLLQVRPALFPVQRNPILTLANHQETLGEWPSPWIVSALVEAGRDLSFLAELTPASASWDETYAVEVGERAWLNLSLWFHWMDHYGLPRNLATVGVGGNLGSPADQQILPGRFIRSVPHLLWQQWLCWRKTLKADDGLKQLQRQLEQSHSLHELYRVTVDMLVLALRTNFAISAVCSAMARLRRFLRIPGSARLVTQDMMEAYSRLRSLPVEQREAALDDWLRKFGHRGPLESDLARPRFAELREVLRGDLAAATDSPSLPPPRKGHGIFRSFFRIDERREWFRDRNMRLWQELRARVLQEAGRLVVASKLERPEDVFWLRGSDLECNAPLRQAIMTARARADAIRNVRLPLTGSLDEINETLQKARVGQAVEQGQRLFTGIALTPAVLEGTALKADDLTALLRDGSALKSDTILVVPTLEPSWAVIFPRVAGVVADLGGELSHASILLREARRPAVVNCTGIFRQIRSGDRLRLDGVQGIVEVL